MAAEFPDGACYVDLADLTNPDLVAARVASAAGVAEESGRPLLDTLADALRLRRLRARARQLRAPARRVRPAEPAAAGELG